MLDLTSKPPIEISVQVDGETASLSVTGRFAIDMDFDPLQRTIDGLLEQGYRDVVLNVREVQVIDSAGLGEIVRLYVHVRKLGRRLKIEGGATLRSLRVFGGL